MNDLVHILPEIFLLLSSLLFLPMVNTRKTILVFFAVLISLSIMCFQPQIYSQLIFNNLIALSPFIQYLKITILVLVAITLLMMNSIDLSKYANELPILIAFSTIGMLSLISAHDLLSMYMAIELQSLPMYVMAALDRKSLQSSEAGLKYFILGAVASGILLYGISMIYGFTGSTNFVNLTTVFRGGNLELGVLLGSILIISALAFKISAVPFHMWTPDVYQGSPTIITAFFSIVPKVALVAFLIRLFNYELVNIKLQQIFITLAMLSMLVSALGALRQTNIKRLFAYSSIGHIGYVLVGIASAIGSSNSNAIAAIVTYMTLYAIMNIGLFSFILRIANYNIQDLSGINKQHPFTAISLALLLLSMAGIPPTAGFITKLYILSSAVQSGLWWLALFSLLTSVISAYYYLRILKVIYFDPAPDQHSKILNSKFLSITTFIAAIINISFISYSGYYLSFLHRIVNYL